MQELCLEWIGNWLKASLYFDCPSDGDSNSTLLAFVIVIFGRGCGWMGGG